MFTLNFPITPLVFYIKQGQLVDAFFPILGIAEDSLHWTSVKTVYSGRVAMPPRLFVLQKQGQTLMVWVILA